MNEKLNNLVLHSIRQYRKPNTLDLTVGEGHFQAPFNAKLGVYEALLMNQTKYSTISGEESLRKKFVSKYYSQYDYEEVVVTNGATQGIFITLMAIINNNSDEIIVLAPYYPAYAQIITLLGAKPVIVDTKDHDFKISITKLKEYLTHNTVGIIINEPCNPTGVTYTLEEKLELLKLFREHKMYVIVDEVYRAYTNEDHVSFAELIDLKLKEQFIFVNSLSKSHLITGFRVGFVLSNKQIISNLQKLNWMIIGSLSKLLQEGASNALDDDYYPNFVKRYYINNTRYLQDELDELNIDYVKGNGGYYVFVRTDQMGLDDEGFTNLFSEKYQLAVVPGRIFGENYQNYVRVSCCRDVKDIIRFVEVLRELK